MKIYSRRGGGGGADVYIQYILIWITIHSRGGTDVYIQYILIWINIHSIGGDRRLYTIQDNINIYIYIIYILMVTILKPAGGKITTWWSKVFTQ
jgi:hypothetical protein